MRAAAAAMRVLQFVTYYPPHRTGLSLYVQRIGQRLVQAGHSVTVVTSRFQPELPAEADDGGVRVVRLPAAFRISRGQVTPSLPRVARQLIAEHDVVNIHSPMLEASLVAHLARRAGRGCVVTHHGDLVLPAGATNRLIERVVERLFRAAARRSQAVIAYTEDYAQHSRYLAPLGDKVTPLYPPIEIPPARPGARERLAARLGLEGDGPVLGYAGRFVEEKRPDLLLVAARALQQRWPGLHVAFAGQYRMPYETFFDRCGGLIGDLSGQVHFLGLLDDPQDVADFYAACDVLVLPSTTECFGLVQAEAMLSGTPVVATDIPGARVPIQVTGMGALARHEDAASLAQAITTVLEAGDRLRRPRHEVEAIFHQDSLAERYAGILEEAYRRARDG